MIKLCKDFLISSIVCATKKVLLLEVFFTFSLAKRREGKEHLEKDRLGIASFFLLIIATFVKSF